MCADRCCSPLFAGHHHHPTTTMPRIKRRKALGGTVSQPQKSNKSRTVAIGSAGGDDELHVDWRSKSSASSNYRRLGLSAQLNQLMPVGDSVTGVLRAYATGQLKGAVRGASADDLERLKRDRDLKRIYPSGTGDGDDAAGRAAAMEAVGEISPELLAQLREGGALDASVLAALGAEVQDAGVLVGGEDDEDEGEGSDSGSDEDESDGYDDDHNDERTPSAFVLEAKRIEKRVALKDQKRRARDFFKVPEHDEGVFMELFFRYGLDYHRMARDPKWNQDILGWRELRQHGPHRARQPRPHE